MGRAAFLADLAMGLGRAGGVVDNADLDTPRIVGGQAVGRAT